MKLILGVVIGCCFSWAAMAERTIFGAVAEMASIANYDSPQGVRIPIEFRCQNISKVNQTITIELLFEKVRLNLCLRNEKALGSFWVKSGDCSYPATYTTSASRKQTLSKVAPGESVSGNFDTACAAHSSGFSCDHKSDGSIWKLIDFKSMTGLQKLDRIPDNCAGIPNCVERGEGYYSFNYKITVEERQGAILCSVTSKTYLYGARDYNLGQFLGPVNNGRPF
ncbi:MAG: hypothetical protein ACKOA8_09580 [Deltaproteobacteria bacterium]